jgi:hypothetical protein
MVERVFAIRVETPPDAVNALCLTRPKVSDTKKSRPGGRLDALERT